MICSYQLIVILNLTKRLKISINIDSFVFVLMYPKIYLAMLTFEQSSRTIDYLFLKTALDQYLYIHVKGGLFANILL